MHEIERYNLQVTTTLLQITIVMFMNCNQFLLLLSIIKIITNNNKRVF